MKTIAGIGVALLTVSCATGPSYVEEDFGRSVRQMVDAQIGDPAAAGDPSPHAPERLDGIAVERTLKGYREGARRGEASDIRLSID